jgi:hypothetical protein
MTAYHILGLGTLIISFILCFVYWIFPIKKRDEEDEKWRDHISLYFLKNMSIALLMSAIYGGVVMATLFMICEIIPPDYENKVYKAQLELLSDNSEMAGRFFLGSGNIGSETWYVCYVKSGENIFWKRYSPYWSNIRYTKGTPMVIGYHRVAKDNLKNRLLGKVGRYCYFPYYIICVPKGSIKNNYQLDGK